MPDIVDGKMRYLNLNKWVIDDITHHGYIEHVRKIDPKKALLYE